MMEAFKLVSAYMILCLFVIGFFVLLGILIDLTCIVKKKRKDNSSTKPVKLFMCISIAGIISFELTCFFTVAVIIQIILIDSHNLHSDIHFIDHIYYELFDDMEYLIAIFDTIGHLCVILVFIARFQYTFRKGTVFNYSKSLIQILYIILFILFICSIGIIILIILHHKTYTIIIFEIIWEISVEIMCLYILYLFVSKLYLLLKLSLTAHIKSGKDTNFMQELTKTIKNSITASKEKSRSGGSHSKGSKGSKGKKSKSSKNNKKCSDKNNNNTDILTLTIDGMVVEPLPVLQPAINDNYSEDVIISNPSSPNIPHKNSPNLNGFDDEIISHRVPMFKLNNNSSTPLNNNSSPKHSPNPSPRHSPQPSLEHVIENEKKEEIENKALPENKELEFQSQCQSQWKSQKDIELTITQTTYNQRYTDRMSTKSNISKNVNVNGAAELVGVMNKMTLLVLFTVFTSIFSVIGNIFIEIHELDTIEKHDIDTQSLWAEILPLIDIIVTSFMLYLQFSFTDRVYQCLLGKMDTWFLRVCLNVLECFWKRSIKGNDEKTMSFIYDNKMQEKKKNKNSGNNEMKKNVDFVK